MWINPLNMLLEADHLNELGVADLTGRTFVDEDARLITHPDQGAIPRSAGRGGGCDAVFRQGRRESQRRCR
jgi:hypothetical protein